MTTRLEATVDLNLVQARQQLDRFENDLRQLRTPIDVQVELTGEEQIAEVRREIDRASGVLDVDVDTADLSRGEQGIRDINEELRLAQDELRQAQTRADALGDELQRTGRVGTGAFSSLRQSIGPLVATFAAGLGIREVVQQFNQAVTAASDLEQSIGGVEAIFGSASDTVLRFGQNAAQVVGLSTAAANQLAVQLGGQLQSYGFSAAEAADETARLITLGADLAATVGGPVSQAVEAVGSLLRGETNPIEQYGVSMNVAAIEAHALEQGIIGTGEQLTIQTKALAALDLLFRQTTGAQGQFAREAETTAGALERMRAEFADIQAEFGEALIPAFEQGIELVREFLPLITDITPIVGLFGSTLGAAAEEAAPFLRILGDSISELGAAVDGLPTDVPILSAIIDGAKGTLNPLGAMSQVIRDFTSGLETGITETGFADVLDQIGRAATEGKDPVKLLAASFEQLDEAGIDAVGFLEQLAGAAGVSDSELVTFTNTLLNNRTALGLTADEVEILLALVRDLIGIDPAAALDFTRRGLGSEFGTDIRESASALDAFRESADAVFDPGAAQRGLAERFGDLPVIVQDLEGLRGALDETGITLQEFLDSGAGDSNIVAVFTEAETQILGVIASIEEAIPGLRNTLLGAFDIPVDEETDKISGDIDTFLDTLDTQAAEAADLEFDLSQIRVVAPDLAQLLADAGLQATDIAEAFAGDLEAAATAEALIDGAEGMATTVAQNYAEFLKTLTPEQVADLGVFAADNFVSNAIRSQLAESATELAQVLTDALDGQTIAPELIIDLSNAQITGLVNTGAIPIPGGSDSPGTGGGGSRIPPTAQFNVVTNVNNPVVVDESTAGTQASQQIAATVGLLAQRPN